MPIHVEEAVEISRPASAVGEFMADLRNEEKWFEGIRRVRILSGQPGSAGARYEFVFRAMNKERKAIDTVVELEPFRRIVIQRDPGPVSTRGVATLTAVAGGTKVNLVLTAQLRGLARLFAGKMRPAMRNGIKASLANLKRVLEASPGGT
jgi:carbon monoxide dehydrogenase subunit G